MANGEAERQGSREGSRHGASEGVRRRPDLLRIGIAIAIVLKLGLVGVWGRSALASGAAKDAAAKPAAPVVERGVAAAGPAPARDEAVVAKAADARPAPGAAKGDVRVLLEEVARRNVELDARERELAAREERLKIFEHDVTAKITSLEEIEKRLLARSKEATAAVAAAGESLAKIYGAMKPADAAPILDQLDEATVLTIFSRMKEKQIGEILPLMSRDKAIVLTRSLAERR